MKGNSFIGKTEQRQTGKRVIACLPCGQVIQLAIPIVGA